MPAELGSAEPKRTLVFPDNISAGGQPSLFRLPALGTEIECFRRSIFLVWATAPEGKIGNVWKPFLLRLQISGCGADITETEWHFVGLESDTVLRTFVLKQPERRATSCQREKKQEEAGPDHRAYKF